MTFQSSFLIRCWLDPTAPNPHVKAYHAQHVQSGAEFRATDLSELIRWMTAENLRHLANAIDSGSPNSLEEIQ